MSLVGPRPLVVDEDVRVEGWHRRRLELTPGMTGPWQILGPTRVPLREMVAIDYLYVANWSLWTDMKILLRTPGLATDGSCRARRESRLALARSSRATAACFLGDAMAFIFDRPSWRRSPHSCFSAPTSNP
jgi:hypothetical protein